MSTSNIGRESVAELPRSLSSEVGTVEPRRGSSAHTGRESRLLAIVRAARALDDAWAEFGPQAEYWSEYATALSSAIEKLEPDDLLTDETVTP